MIGCKHLTSNQIKALYNANEQFIYLYTFLDGKTYVGQTRKSSNRYGQPSIYKPKFPEMYQAMKESGYTKQILCFVSDKEEADELEDFYIEQYNSIKHGYNRRTGGKTGFVMSNETRKKMSESHIGENNYWYGKHLPEDTKQKISEACKGKNNPNYGKHHSNETKQKMSEAKKGKNNPNYGKRGSECSNTRTVKLIDAKELTEKIYECIKDILKDFPNFNYKSLYNTLTKNRLYQQRYKLEYVDKNKQKEEQR